MSSSGFDFSFNAPSVPRSGLVFAKSRVSKRRSINRPNVKPDNQAGPGANPFLHASEYSSVLRSSQPAETASLAAEAGSGSNDATGGLREGVIDEMSNLKIGGNDKPADAATNLKAKSSVASQSWKQQSSSFVNDEFVASKLPEDMRKLNIEDLNSRPVDIDEGTKLKEGISWRNLETELPNDLKNLNIKGSEKFGSENVEATAQDLKKLNIKGSEKLGGENVEATARAPNARTVDMNLKTEYASNSAHGGRRDGSRHSSGAMPTENVLSHEMEKKLNLRTGSKSSSSKTDRPKFSFVSTQPFAFTTGENVPKKDNTDFASKQMNTEMPFVEFTTPVSKVNLVSGAKQKIEFAATRETVSSSKLKKKKGKLRPFAPVPPQPTGQESVTSGNSSVEQPEASDSYSPMEVSPYQENVVNSRSSREHSVTSSESFGHLDNSFAANSSEASGLNDAVDEDLVAATQRMEINSDDEHGEVTKEASMNNQCQESVSAGESESFKTALDDIDSTKDDSVTSSAKPEANCSLNLERKESWGSEQFGLVSHSEEAVGSNFTFSASSSASTGQVSALKRHSKKKTSGKASHSLYSVEVPYASSSSVLSFSSASLSPHLSPQLERGSRSPFHHRGKDSKMNTGQDMKPESPSNTAAAASVAAQEACEKWRLRGNQAYSSGDMSKAEDCYTQGINCISENEMSRSCLRALMLCYSNRAATRMSLGRMRDALGDCLRATEIDPNFFRVQVRAANCYLALGEMEDALQFYKKCLQAGSDVCADRKIAVEASEGILKAQKVSECINHSSELLISRASQDAESTLEIIAEALTISVYSEKLIEMKAQILFMLQRYQEVIQLCEQTLDSAEKNSPSVDADVSLAYSDDTEFSKRLHFRLWRCSLTLKSYFHLGKLEEGLTALEKQVEQLSIANRSGSSILESLVPLLRTVRELIRLKGAGNDAFQAGKHAEAIEHYTAALSYNAECRPFSAICLCNRAAAYKALGQITDAIADCSLAIALDGNYLKAISRRAALYEMIRDYGQAAADLERLISVLTKQVEEKTTQGGGYDKSLSCVNELRRARLHLSEIEEAAKKDVPLDLYLILGVDSTVSVLEIKKAYRKLALRHHPDKASQFLAKGDNGDDKLWKGIAEEVHKDADRLFKMIGEAYAVLSDSVKRARYDLEEETRIALKRRNEASSYRTTRDEQYYPFESSSSTRHQQREYWRSHNNTQPRSESNRYTWYK